MYKLKEKSRVNMNNFWDFFLSSDERIPLYYDMLSMNQRFYL